MGGRLPGMSGRRQKMTVYKICFDGNYCVFKNLEDAKEMLICEMGGNRGDGHNQRAAN